MTREHEHHHEHEHEHEHEHHEHHHRDHEHHEHHAHQETVELEWGRLEFEAHVHDQAATVSLTAHPKEGCAIAFSDLVRIMESIARAAEEAGGIVGHIKAFAQQDGESAHASVTSADLASTVEGSSSLSFGAGATVQLVAIVLLIDQADLLAICKKELAS